MNRYRKQYNHPLWIKLSKAIKNRDGNACKGKLAPDGHRCGVTVGLAVHHKVYVAGLRPYEYPPRLLITLCEDCHERETHKQRAGRAAVRRARKRLSKIR